MLEISPKNNTIELQLEVENTTIDQVSSRLIVEVDDNMVLIPLNTSYDGVVNGKIPLKEEWEGKIGRLKLEVINENNYFVPFEKTVFFTNIPQITKSPVKEVRSVQPVQPAPRPKPIAKPIIEHKKSPAPKNKPEDLRSEIQNFFKTL